MLPMENIIHVKIVQETFTHKNVINMAPQRDELEIYDTELHLVEMNKKLPKEPLIQR